jgi:hypothetical protein
LGRGGEGAGGHEILKVLLTELPLSVEFIPETERRTRTCCGVFYLPSPRSLASPEVFSESRSGIPAFSPEYWDAAMYAVLESKLSILISPILFRVGGEFHCEGMVW